MLLRTTTFLASSLTNTGRNQQPALFLPVRCHPSSTIWFAGAGAGAAGAAGAAGTAGTAGASAGVAGVAGVAAVTGVAGAVGSCGIPSAGGGITFCYRY